MVEISLLQFGEWNALNELKWSGVLCIQGEGEWQIAEGVTILNKLMIIKELCGVCT